MGTQTASAIDIFRDVLQEPDKVALDWKAQGKKVVGYRCIYVPEEVIWAADMLSYPLYAAPTPVGLADSYFQSCTCEFVRKVFDHGLEGRFQFLDCLALANTCDLVRRLFDMWGTYIKDVPVYMVNNPQKLMTEVNRDYYLEELHRFKAAMEQLSGNRITDDKLEMAIDLHNETRTLLKELYLLRRQDPPSISGSEALQIVMATSIMPKDKANPLLRRLLTEVR
jgi:benzoyl-CoA reductase subunit C